MTRWLSRAAVAGGSGLPGHGGEDPPRPDLFGGRSVAVVVGNASAREIAAVAAVAA